MKNIGILGYGSVGRTTARYLQDSERHFVIFDENEAIQKAGTKEHHVSATLLKYSGLDALIVCINIPHPLTCNLKHAEYHNVIAQYLSDSLLDVLPVLNEGAPILVRTTVPPGTCDALQLLHPNNPVLAWPEFSKEASLRSGTGDVKAPYLGLGPHMFDEDEGDGLAVARVILGPSELDAELLSSNVYQNKQVEFLKLAWNVRRAADVAIFNTLAHAAVDMGIDPVLADHLVENARPHYPQWSTLAFGGKCLDKDLWTWDAATGGTLGLSLRTINRTGPTEAVKLAFKAHALLNLDWTQRPVILGLQDGPGSKTTHHAPALQMMKARKWAVPPLFVDPIKSVCSSFWQLLVKGGHDDHASCAAPDSLMNTNMIIIAQKSFDNSIYNALKTILQGSDEPVKVVVNACNMQFSDKEIIEAQKWGAVFVDQQEVKRMLAEANPFKQALQK